MNPKLLLPLKKGGWEGFIQMKSNPPTPPFFKGGKKIRKDDEQRPNS